MKKLMKHIVTIALFALLTCSVQFPVSAAQVSGEVLYGTPVLDGVMDELYTASASFELDNPNFYVWGDCTGTDSTAKGYFLWDENYLYYAVEVQDATPATAGPEAGWQDDCVEMWFMDEYITYKVHTASSGRHFLGVDADGKTPYDFSASQAFATATDTGYVVEVALPFNKLEAGRTFNMALQVCDILTDDPGNGTAHGQQVPSDEYVCVETTAAPSTDVLYGTPELDGEIDKIYTKSVSFELDNPNFYVWGDCTGTDTTAKGYFLWDENYLYYAVEVQDATPATAGPEAGWQDDCVEMWFMDEYITYKVHTASSGRHFLGADADGKTPYDFSASQAFATTTDTGYVVEVALPFNKLAAGRTFNMALQVCDILTDDPNNGTAHGQQVPSIEYTCVEKTAAPSTKVQNGTPVLDGQMDDIYKTSAGFELDNPNFYVWGDCTGTDTTAYGYFLWDNDYLYYAVEVKDATPATAGPEAGWQDDCVEMWFLDEYITYKVHTASSGRHFLGADADGKTPYDFSASQAFATTTDTGYVVEVALPFNKLAADRTFSLALQVCDILTDDPNNGTAHGQQVPSIEFTLVGGAEPIITEVQKGTPELDGKMDDIYTTSANFVLDNPNFYVWGDCTGTDTTAKGYFLWDENYLYYAVEVKDATPATAGPEAGWQDDCVEMWFLDEYITYKVHTASSGLHFLGADADGKTPYDFSKSQAFATTTDDGYVVEVALPFNALDGGRTFSLALQVCDILTDDPSNGTAHGQQVPSTEYTLVGKAEVVEEPSEAPSEEVETPVDTPVEEPAEETSNVGVIIAIIAAVIVIAAIAVVVAKKKKAK